MEINMYQYNDFYKKNKRSVYNFIYKMIHDPLQAEVLTQYALGFSYDEIADELNLPIGTVKATMHHARNKMKELFNKPAIAVLA